MLRLLFTYSFIFFAYACNSNQAAISNTDNESKRHDASDYLNNEWRHLHQSLDSIQTLLPATLRRLNFNERLVLIAHLGIHSGLPRMILWNVEKQQITDSGLVAHGYGKEDFSQKAIFSNEPGSYSSSLGKYKIGEPYKGNFGWSYKLYGLEPTNSKAFERFVVLHAYTCVAETSIYPNFCCNSQGCPMVSLGYLKRLSKKIDASEKPMLLWIIE